MCVSETYIRKQHGGDEKRGSTWYWLLCIFNYDITYVKDFGPALGACSTVGIYLALYCTAIFEEAFFRDIGLFKA